MKLDPSKIKRIFTFGCSFTNFIWPTWADIVAYEFSDIEFYNLGLSGTGNLSIAARISEANVRYNFTENDLIMIMWSTYLREDRWLNGTWLRSGNVYNNSLYNKDFLKNYADVCGYLIRDGALISMTELYLKQLPCQSLMMKSVSFDHLETNDYDFDTRGKNYQEIINLYNPVFDRMPISLYDFLCKKYDILQWPISHEYYCDEMDMMHSDSHPLPIDAFTYINNHVLELSNDTLDYAINVTNRLKKLNSKKLIISEFSKDDRQNFLF